MARPRLVGVNHVALEVGDVDAAIEFYGRLFDFELRGRVRGMAFIDLGDQFLALSEGRRQPADDGRHFGLVVDDLDAARRALADAGVSMVQGARGVDFRDPWGNRVELVGYPEIQFTKAPGVARGMGLDEVSKTPAAIQELRDKGLL
jgi:catechol 2,3-dioxygenase-like lactoylglutathione lyase family enzyme